MKTLVTIGIMLVAGATTYAQDFREVDAAKFRIKQKSDYSISGHVETKDADGPILRTTYIDDTDCKTIADLGKHYSFADVSIPAHIPNTVDIKSGKFVLIKCKDNYEMPAVKTADGTYFSFTIEEGFLTLDYKYHYDKDGASKIGYATVEVEKK